MPDLVPSTQANANTFLGALIDPEALASVSMTDLGLQVEMVNITDATSFAEAETLLGFLKTTEKAVDAERDNRYKALTAVEGFIMGDVRDMLKKIQALTKIVKEQHLLPYLEGEEKKRREKQEAADRLARAERERLADLAAKEAEKSPEKAAVIAATASVITAPTIAPTVALASGSSVARPWTAILDPDMLEQEAVIAIAKYIVLYPAHASLLSVNMNVAKSIAKMQMGAMAIPGLKATQTATFSKRG